VTLVAASSSFWSRVHLLCIIWPNGAAHGRGLSQGPPGTGTSTISAHLAIIFNLLHYDQHDEIRNMVANTPESRPAAAYFREPIAHRDEYIHAYDIAPCIRHGIRFAFTSHLRRVILDSFPNPRDHQRGFDEWPFPQFGIPGRPTIDGDIVLPPDVCINLQVDFAIALSHVKQLCEAHFVVQRDAAAGEQDMRG
jgi:hypothetical protein